MAKRQPNPYFKFQKFTVYHDQCAMKVGTDGVLLGAWVDVSNATNGLDIGTGTGLISLMMAQRSSSLNIMAIDIDDSAIDQAKTNINQSPYHNRITTQKVPLQELPSDNKYDLIVSNPPFFNDSLKSSDNQRNLARHTDSLPLEDLLESASKLLTNRGKLSLIYPHEYKERLISLAPQYNLSISRLTDVYPTPTSPPKRILIELSRENLPTCENKLVIEESRHIYSADFKVLVEDFYLNVR